MKVDVLNMQGQKVATTELPAAIFEAPILEEVMHQALVRQLANGRLGTRKTKTRGEVSGGGKKPWRQKGTGRARQGSIRSPQWRGGGRVHTPMPRDFSLRMPRKMRHAALRSALSVKAAQSEIVVLDQLTMAGPKTKEMAAALTRLVGDASALIILPGPDEMVEKSVRNLPTAKTLRASYLNIRDLLGYDRVVMPMGTVDALGTALAA
ncbi:MAG: 50S ribosomal protein L4 [Chloroflexi bacterium]|nr:50S ribosomal protein L4 [Chloroflexota bacterium]